MKLLVPLSLVFGMIFFSCATETTNDSIQETSQITDTTVIVDSIIDQIIEIEVDPKRNVIDVEKLFSKASENFELPLKIDSSFLEKYALQGEDSEYNLNGQEVKHLGFSFPTEANISNSKSWQIKTFTEIDSLKKNGGYDDYLSALDIGQTKYSAANAFGKVNVNEQSIILLWSLDFSTYEACPYGYGTFIFGTVFTNNTATNTSLLAEKSGGGDPPAWGDDYTESELNDSTIAIYRLERWGEEDYETGEEYVEKREMRELLELSPYGLNVLEKDDFDY